MMKLIDLKNIKFPTKKDEEFRKIDLSLLYGYEFKEKKDHVLDFDVLKNDELSSNNELYKINQNLDAKSYELNIVQNTDEPIVIIHKLNDDAVLNTSTLNIKVAKEVQASVIEVFVSNCQNSFYSVNRTFEVEQSANLNYFKYQDIKESNSLIINTIIDLKDKATIEHSNFELGDGVNVNIYETALNSEESNLNINGLVRLYNETKSSSIFNTYHNNKSSFSNINFKHSLHDHSRAVFEAKSIVNDGANFSKVLQNSNTILLSDDAVIFAKPHLEIHIDELEASHGATVGSLNQEQLLYLRARGISDAKAYEMLLSAFENEIYENIKDDKIKEFITNFKRSDYV